MYLKTLLKLTFWSAFRLINNRVKQDYFDSFLLITIKDKMDQNTVNFSFTEFYLFVHYLRKIQGGRG